VSGASMPISDFICRYVMRSMAVLTRPRSWVSSSEPGIGVGFWGGRVRVGVHDLVFVGWAGL
jgi:hypothetical protein